MNLANVETVILVVGFVVEWHSGSEIQEGEVLEDLMISWGNLGEN